MFQWVVGLFFLLCSLFLIVSVIYWWATFCCNDSFTFSSCGVSYRQAIFSISMTFQIFGMFLFYFGSVRIFFKAGFYRFHCIHFDLWVLYKEGDIYSLIQNQNAHNAILKQLNCLRWVFLHSPASKASCKIGALSFSARPWNFNW